MTRRPNPSPSPSGAPKAALRNPVEVDHEDERRHDAFVQAKDYVLEPVAAVCVELMGSVHQGWNISNGQGRMLTVTSAAGTSAAIDSGNSTAIASLSQTPQAGSDGFVYWNFTAETGIVNYTSVYIF